VNAERSLEEEVEGICSGSILNIDNRASSSQSGRYSHQFFNLKSTEYDAGNLFINFGDISSCAGAAVVPS
jgi:hypothetical protein